MASFGISKTRPHEPPMPEPLAFFITWTTYGTWLPGDERGWVLKGKGFQLPRPITKKLAAERMTEPPCTLSDAQHDIVEKTIREHCDIRNWELHAVNCRTNHVHVVVTADLDPKTVRDQFKAWCTRKLKEHCRNLTKLARSASKGGDIPIDGAIREKWWTEGGSQRFIGDQESLEAVIHYVLEGQDKSRE